MVKREISVRITYCTTRVHFETDADFVGIKFEAYVLCEFEMASVNVM